MREIKLTGREIALLRAIDFATGSQGAAVIEFTRLSAEEVADLVNGLLEVGYLETLPPTDRVTAGTLPGLLIDVNPAYAQLLRAAMFRGR